MAENEAGGNEAAWKAEMEREFAESSRQEGDGLVRVRDMRRRPSREGEKEIPPEELRKICNKGIEEFLPLVQLRIIPPDAKMSGVPDFLDALSESAISQSILKDSDPQAAAWERGQYAEARKAAVRLLDVGVLHSETPVEEAETEILSRLADLESILHPSDEKE